jgi:tetratricopeptide (TPR) repeat protein
MRLSLSCMMLLVALIYCSVSVAEIRSETDARAQFEAGAEAFREQDFESALAAFRAALDAGLTGPAVHYNIGVCAWELGRLDEAEAAFLAASAYPAMAATAFYNLGLVRQRRGDGDGAAHWFELARDLAQDQNLRLLAESQLPLPPTAPTTPTASTPWPTRPVRFAAVHAGYDDNVALIAEEQVLGISDTGSAYLEVQYAGMTPLRNGLRLEGSAYLLRYESLDEYDQAGARLGMVAGRQWERWVAELGTDYGLNMLDGERFEDRRGIWIGALRQLDAGGELRLRYRFEDIVGQDEFDTLSGQRHEAGLRLALREAGRRWRLEYRYETNDRDSEIVSPDRHRVDGELSLELGRRIAARLGSGWRHSRYELQDGSRTERRSYVSAALSGPLTKQLDWLVRVDLARNSSSEAAFDYTQRRAFAGIEALF